VAIIAISALFAVAHLGSQVWVSIIPLFLVGLNLAFFTTLRRSLIPAIIGHWLFNFANVMWMRHVLSGGFVAL
jgi:membrane protease YdiL (CAAX protease family)